VPKLIDELLRSELMCLNQVVLDRFRLAYSWIIVIIHDELLRIRYYVVPQRFRVRPRDR
jgi:hypothetical protein